MRGTTHDLQRNGKSPHETRRKSTSSTTDITPTTITADQTDTAVAVWLNFLGGANYEIGAPGIFILICALHH